MQCPMCQAEWNPTGKKVGQSYWCETQLPRHKFRFDGEGKPLVLLGTDAPIPSVQPTTVKTAPVKTTPDTTQVVEVKKTGIQQVFGFKSRVNLVKQTEQGSTTSNQSSSQTETMPRLKPVTPPQQGTTTTQSSPQQVSRGSSDPLPPEFEKLEGGPVGKGIFQFEATRLYRPAKPLEIPGTNFKDVCPGQAHVNRMIVEAKIAAGLPATPVVPVALNKKDGSIALVDKHHTFVACMALGRPVKLAFLQKNTSVNVMSDWQSCTWKGFEKPKQGVAAGGFKMSKEESTQLEGEKQSSGDWKKIVPWRKGEPDNDQGRVAELMKLPSFKGKAPIGEEITKACQDDPGLAEKLYELVKIALVKIKIRPKPQGSTGGDWNAVENEIYLDNDLQPLDMVDMLVFEAYNAIHQGEFSQLQHKAHDERMGPDNLGVEKAKIEAKTELAYLEHLFARKEKNSPISASGQRHLDAIDLKFIDKEIPGYSKMSVEQRQQYAEQVKGIKVYSKMTKEERKQNEEAIKEIFISSPHDGRPGVVLPQRNALMSKELYAYEHVADTQNIKGIVAYFKDKVPENHPKSKAFLKAIAGYKDCAPRTPSMSWAGKFYDIVSEAANRILGAGVPTFSAEQKQVAADEYQKTGGNWEGKLTAALEQVAL